MTPKLVKYFTIPWLDQIAVIMDTFRTPDIFSFEEYCEIALFENVGFNPLHYIRLHDITLYYMI
jgi:hypothetical protein